MADISGAKLTQNTSSQSAKAEALGEIVENIAKKINEIDVEIQSLVKGGLEGNSVQTMAKTYLHNREVISDYVKRFAATAYELDESAKAMQKAEQQADEAASGKAGA